MLDAQEEYDEDCCRICDCASRSYLHSHQQHTGTLTKKHVHEVHYAPWQEIQAIPCYLPTQDRNIVQQMIRYFVQQEGFMLVSREYTQT